MHRALIAPLSSLLLLLALMVSQLHLRAAAPVLADRVWYIPNPGSIDLQRMVEHPEEWVNARQLMDVFQFTQQHTQSPADEIVGPNSYDALARAGVFRAIRGWGKKTSIGVGAVKNFYCTDDSSGMNAAIANGLAAIRAVQQAGGAVNYLAMDEPFLAGRAPRCGGPDLQPTADRLATYVNAVKSSYPQVQIGLIEAYPASPPDGFSTMLQLMRGRGVAPAFLHLDVDIRALRPGRDDFVRDIKQLQAICAGAKVPFGIIIWGYNGDADALFARDAYTLANAFHDAFTDWASTPDQFIFESWSVSSTGLLITPSNLPEYRSYTLTNILLNSYRRFRGQSGPATGVAAPR